MGFEVVEEKREPLARIRVIGVGGGGGNAVNNMILNGMEVEKMWIEEGKNQMGLDSDPYELTRPENILNDL